MFGVIVVVGIIVIVGGKYLFEAMDEMDFNKRLNKTIDKNHNELMDRINRKM